MSVSTGISAASAAALVGGIILGLGAVAIALGSPPRIAPETPRAEPSVTHTFPTNERGQTYGTLFPPIDSELSPEEWGTPDLVRVVMDSGESGYVLAGDLLFPIAKNPEEALRIQESRPKSPSFTAYAQDGVTIIGKYSPVAREATRGRVAR